MNIFPAITTTKDSDWRKMIKEAKKMELKEICFFLTCLDLSQRNEFYELAKGLNAPFAHLRSDMELWELDYLIKNHSTQVFNIHSAFQYPFKYDYSRYAKMIFIENHTSFHKKELDKFGGICLDLSHLENDRLTEKGLFEAKIRILEEYPIGCNHISAVRENLHEDEYGNVAYANHMFQKLSEFDYLKRYPKEYFSDFVALELENSLADQLRAKSYILSLLS